MFNGENMQLLNVNILANFKKTIVARCGGVLSSIYVKNSELFSDKSWQPWAKLQVAECYHDNKHYLCEFTSVVSWNSCPNHDSPTALPMVDGLRMIILVYYINHEVSICGYGHHCGQQWIGSQFLNKTEAYWLTVYVRCLFVHLKLQIMVIQISVILGTTIKGRLAWNPSVCTVHIDIYAARICANCVQV